MIWGVTEAASADRSPKLPRARALTSTNTRSGPLTAHLVRGDCKLVAKMEHTSPSPGGHRMDSVILTASA